MKHILLFLSIALVLSSCLSEAEKRAKERIAFLDTRMDENRTALEAFFSGLTALNDQLSDIQPASDSTGLQPELLETYRMMLDEYQSVHPENVLLKYKAKGMDLKTNALVFHPEGAYTKKDIRGLISNVKILDKQRLSHIHDRIIGEKWHYTIGEADHFYTEEREQEEVEEYEKLIDRISACQYVLGVRELMVQPGKMLSDGDFEAGNILVRVFIYDMESGAIDDSFFLEESNSFMIMTISDSEAGKEAELLRDLRHQVYTAIDRRLEEEDSRR